MNDHRRHRGLGSVLLLTLLPMVSLSIGASVGDASHPAGFDEALYAAEVAEFEAFRVELAERYARETNKARADIRRLARQALTSFLSEAVFPAWRGTRWGMGKDANARRPHDDGRAISCSGFIAAALADAGVRLQSRSAFAQAAAIDIQRSLVGVDETVHRFVGISSDELAAEMVALGDGIYLIGLARHVGFVHVGRGRATIVHSGASGKGAVQFEPLADALPVTVSHPSGYWVTALTASEHLVEAWLANKAHRLVRRGLPESRQ